MKRQSFLFLVLLLFAVNCIQAQQKTTAANKSLLWRISGKKLAKPSYIFGTMHLICPDDYVWTNKMKESLDKSDQVCLEMNLDDPGIMMKAAMGMVDKSGKKLKDYFTPQQYKLLTRYLKDSMGTDIAMFEQMKPIMLETMISSGGMMCDSPVSYEDSLIKIAKRSKKEIMGLEEPQEQIDALESIPVDSVIKDLMDETQNRNKGSDKEYHQLMVAYKTQDLPALYNLLMTSKQFGNDMGKFLDDRNKRWISRMEPKMQHSSVFFAVGAGHLWGSVGVINLLRKQGYVVEAIR
jgi:uncharacterized protein